MAAVTYRPGPHDPATVEWGGTTFPANVPMEVSNAHILRKALGNPFFEVEGEAPVNGVPHPDEKEALVSEAEALGLDVDKRWGVAKLRAAIDAKKAEG